MFVLDREGVARLLKTEREDHAVVEAAKLCPTEAITVWDAETGAKIWPP